MGVEKDGHPLRVHVQGQLVFNSSPPILRAALAGFGLASVPEGMVRELLAAGRLRRVLEDWCPVFPGYHAQRRTSPAVNLVIEALRYRPEQYV